MEESENRRERLNGIREEAVEAGGNTEEQNSIILTNPLIETPMEAFSPNNNNNNNINISPQLSQPCNKPPRLVNAGSPAYHGQGNYHSAKRTYKPRGVNAIPLGIRRNSSNTSDSSLDTPEISEVSSHGSPQGCGVGSPYQDSGSKSRPSRGTKRSRGRFKSYYHQSMVEDPWKVLKRVIWKPRVNTHDSRKSWFPQFSSSAKKATLGGETPTTYAPQRSLAEYLAAAFIEAAGKDTVNNESTT